MSRIRDIANILSGGSSAIATDAEITSAVSAQFVAGKNKIINGDFGIWQRGTTFTPVLDTVVADRFKTYCEGSGTTRSLTQQTFTPGTAPVAGYEGRFFMRYAQTVGPSAAIGNNLIWQNIEDVRTFAGQTVTFSFWAKAAATTVLDSVYAYQVFGTGGSPSGNVQTFFANNLSIGTSWTRYSFTAAIPSIAGKTIGTNNDSYISIRTNHPLGSGNTFTVDYWGWQVEAGSTATNFATATGTFATELAACQRYYQTSFDLGQTPAHNGSYYGEMTLSCVNGGFNTNSYGAILFPTKMRTAPTVNIWNTRNASVSGNSARFYNSGTAYDTSSIDMGTTTSSSHGMTFKGANIGASAIVFFGYSASAEL